MTSGLEKKIGSAIKTHQKLTADLLSNDLDTIASAAKLVIDSIKTGGCVYICGNGGSAADAQHIAGELIGRFLRERKALPAVALSTDTSVLTSIANDYSYDDIFVRQVEGLVKRGDLLWAISTSGNSANVVKAAILAKEKNAKVLAFTGRSKSKLHELADICLCVEGQTSYQIQQIHQIVYHIICDLVEESFCK
jgi:D-sedoheptulose 7-phosphate isomerase